MKHLGRPCQALSRKRVVAGLLASEPRVGGLAVLAKVSALVEATRPWWRAVLVTALCLVTTSEVVYLALPCMRGGRAAFVSSCARRRVDCVGEWERVLASLRRVCRTVGHGGGAGRVGRARLCWRVKRVLAGLRCWRGERVLSRPCTRCQHRCLAWR